MYSIVENYGKSDNWSKETIINLLQADGALQQNLFAKARKIRRKYNINDVLLRGVIEISNYCQKKCDYCAMGCSNPHLERYRMGPDEILNVARKIKEAGINVAFLQSGQDPLSDHIVEEVIPRIRHELGMRVLLCLGEKDRQVYKQYADLGAESYIIKFETSDPAISTATLHTPHEKRLQCIHWVKEAGMKLGTGNIIGLPNQTLESLAEDIQLACELQPSFVSSAPFIPSHNTPLSNHQTGDLNLTLNTMALLRILLKTVRIPAISALETIQQGGQVMGLNAGANIITVNFTPDAIRQKYVIYKKGRFVVKLDHTKKIIEQAGLRVIQEYHQEELIQEAWTAEEAVA